jgi:predicted phage terminase large subunit-like protein
MCQEFRRRKAKEAQSRRGGLIEFVRYFWHVLEPETQLVDGWPLEAICQHLEAVTFGEITRLLINVPPGFMKSLLTDVFWPAWEWGPMARPHLRYIAFSYSASLTERDNDRFRTLITSRPYQALYGPKNGKDGVTLRNKTTLKVMNVSTGWKLASSVGGVGTGERGDRVIIDDPHNVVEAESETVRAETVRWFRESVSSRFNNLEEGALVIIMQRLHADDVSGTILDLRLPYCLLMIPWGYDSSRQVNKDGSPFENGIGWVDPRYNPDDPEGNDGEAAWPARFAPEAIERTQAEIGPYGWAGQYQQSPTPRGGGIFKEEWWQLWEAVDGKFPPFEYILASLDSSYTEKEENDPSGLTVWGIFRNNEGKRRIMLVHAWRKHLQFSGPRNDQRPNESREQYRRRTMADWGLMEWVHDTCIRFKVDRLLIEAKASGLSAAQEIQNRFGLQDWAVQLCPVKGDKMARALACQPTFSQLMVYAPEREWAEMVIEEMSKFPRFKYDDLTDSATQAIKHMREVGLAQTDHEVYAEEIANVTYRPRSRMAAIYPA